MLCIRAGHESGLVGSTAVAQHTPVVVTLAGAQHLPLIPTGMRPLAQHCPPPMWIGGIIITEHWALFGPLGTCPLGQHVPVEVIWLARQHEPPDGT
jgi:hypothetical protein